MSPTNEEKWHECDFVGIIKKFDERRETNKQIELLDDYDERRKLGGRFHKFSSRFDRMEC